MKACGESAGYHFRQADMAIGDSVLLIIRGALDHRSRLRYARNPAGDNIWIP